MNVEEMHYDFKQKLNLIDSQRFEGLVVPEIDWKLNEAQELFCKMIAQPRNYSVSGFESSQRTIDDIRTIVVNQKPADYIVPTVFDDSSFLAGLPSNYWFYVKGRAIAEKGKCLGKVLRLVQIQSDDEDDISPFDKSSFEWRESVIRFIDEGIRIFTDSTYIIKKVALNYLRRPRMIYYASGWIGGTYTTLNGIVLTGTQDCELPEGVHKEIVDLAVLLTVLDLTPSVQSKQAKFKLATE